jgi:hypothetical protein
MDNLPDSAFHSGRSTSQKVFDALGAFGAGVEGKGNEYIAQREALTEQRKKALVQDFRKTLIHLQSGNVDTAQQLLQNRLGAIQKLGGDPYHTQGLLQMIQAGPEGIQQALGELSAFDEAAVASGTLEPMEKYVGNLGAGNFVVQGPGGLSVKQPEGFTPEMAEQMRRANMQFAGNDMVLGPDGQYYTATRRADPSTGQVEMVMTPMGEGFRPVDPLGLTPEERVQQRASEAGASARAQGVGSGQATRLNETIDIGRDAAMGVPVIRRSIALLDEVNTGGANYLKLKGKQLLGIENAEEGEIANLLGKAVLSQLRATFGAQFTQKEGETLAKIEAGLGKSTEANKRVLNQLYQLVEGRVKRAIDAAREVGDYQTIKELTELMTTDMTPESFEAMFQPGQPVPESMTAPPASGPRFLGWEQ